MYEMGYNNTKTKSIKGVYWNVLLNTSSIQENIDQL